MRIESLGFRNGGRIPVRYTCDGQNINPSLQFFDVPEGCRSLVLIMDDIDVPRSNRPDGIWNHWLLWNIPPDTREIAEGTVPRGVQGHTTGGELQYQGPCPPDGEHRYVFKLFALDTTLDLDLEATRRPDLLKAMEGHILASAELVGRYNRRR